MCRELFVVAENWSDACTRRKAEENKLDTFCKTFGDPSAAVTRSVFVVNEHDLCFQCKSMTCTVRDVWPSLAMSCGRPLMFVLSVGFRDAH
jgi:hypothetical protein